MRRPGVPTGPAALGKTASAKAASAWYHVPAVIAGGSITPRAASAPAASARRAVRWSGNMILLFTIDAVMGAMVRGDWPDDDDDDGMLDDWALFAAKQTGLTVLGAFPGGSSMVSISRSARSSSRCSQSVQR